jgi:hypothetical protein
MTVMVEPIFESISRMICSFCGPILSDHDTDALNYCQSLGAVYSGFVDGEFTCCWGLIPPTFLSNQAYLWMWAPEPIKHQLVFIRHSQIQVAKMLERYDAIVGHCKIESRSAQRWLQWLGAEFGSPKDGMVPFTIRRSA